MSPVPHFLVVISNYVRRWIRPNFPFLARPRWLEVLLVYLVGFAPRVGLALWGFWRKNIVG